LKVTFNDERYIKCGSAAERDLLAGPLAPGTSWSPAVVGQVGSFVGTTARIGDYWNAIEFACGASWLCADETSVQAKARDVRARLAEATRQIPAGEAGVVHIALECMNGVAVERTRLARIDNTMRAFDFRDADIKLVLCHLLRPYLPGDKNWDLEETVMSFRRSTGWQSPTFLAAVPPALAK
jgi:hypothetical protein